MAEWQPIDTAPKDGTPVLLWDKANYEPVVALFSRKRWFVNNSYGFNEDGEIPGGDVTHWMSLPSPPNP